MFGWFGNPETKARAAFKEGLEALMRGEQRSVRLFTEGLKRAGKVGDAGARALLLADFAAACHQLRQQGLDEGRDQLLRGIQDTTAGQTAIALYFGDYQTMAALFASSIDGTERRAALDDALDTEGADYPKVVSRGWLEILHGHLRSSDFDAAVEALQASTSIFVNARGPDSVDAAQALAHGAFLFSMVGAMQAAVDVGDEAIALLDRGGHEELELRQKLHTRGAAHGMVAGVVDEAKQHAVAALALAEQREDNVAMCLQNAGNMFLSSGDADAAIGYFERAFEREADTAHDRATAAGMLGNLHSVRDRFEEATTWFTRAVEGINRDDPYARTLADQIAGHLEAAGDAHSNEQLTTYVASWQGSNADGPGAQV